MGPVVEVHVFVAGCFGCKALTGGIAFKNKRIRLLLSLSRTERERVQLPRRRASNIQPAIPQAQYDLSASPLVQNFFFPEESDSVHRRR